MNDPKQQQTGLLQTMPVTTREATTSERVQEDADEMAEEANRSERTFDDKHGIFDKI